MIPIHFVYNKALHRLQTAEWNYLKKDYYSLVSNLYFAVFQFMHAMLGEPTDTKWKHIGINQAFNRYMYENSFLPMETRSFIHESYTKLYDYRKRSDYESNRFDDTDIEDIIRLFNAYKKILNDNK